MIKSSKLLNSFNTPQEIVLILLFIPSYSLLLPLHTLHNAYLSELLALPAYSTPLPPPPNLTGDWITAKLIKADFTGARLLVKTAKNPCLMGLEGLVVKETGETFVLVTEDGVVKGQSFGEAQDGSYKKDWRY